MATDPAVKAEAHSTLSGLFSHIGSQGAQGGGGPLGMLTGELEKFMELPLDVAKIFIDMSEQLAEVVIKALEEAGMELLKLVPGAGG